MKNIRYFGLLFTALLIGCQSTKMPDWYLSPEQDNNAYLYSVGTGSSYESASSSAVSNLNNRLWSEVNSSFYNRVSASDRNGKSHTSDFIDKKVFVKSAKAAISGYEVNEVSVVGEKTYIQLRFNKQVLLASLQASVQEQTRQLKFAISSLPKSDPIKWLISNRNLDEKADELVAKSSMVKALRPEFEIDYELLNEVSAAQGQALRKISIAIDARKKDDKAKFLFSNHLSELGINVVANRSRELTHRIVIRTEQRNSEVGDAYIATILTELKLVDRKNRTVSSNEFISTGNSITSKKMAREGAIRHFDDQLSKSGVWKSLGLVEQ